MRDEQYGESRINIRNYEEICVLKSNKIGLFCCHIAKVIAFGTEMTHGRIKLTSEKTLLPFLGLKFFPLGLGFFLQKRKKAFGDAGLSFSFKRNAFR